MSATEKAPPDRAPPTVDPDDEILASDPEPEKKMETSSTDDTITLAVTAAEVQSEILGNPDAPPVRREPAKLPLSDSSSDEDAETRDATRRHRSKARGSEDDQPLTHHAAAGQQESAAGKFQSLPFSYEPTAADEGRSSPLVPFTVADCCTCSQAGRF
jgi:hypothetical protein